MDPLNFIITEKALLYLQAALDTPIIRVEVYLSEEEGLTYEFFDIDSDEITDQDSTLSINGVDVVIARSKLLNLQDITLDLKINNDNPVFIFYKNDGSTCPCTQ